MGDSKVKFWYIFALFEGYKMMKIWTLLILFLSGLSATIVLHGHFEADFVQTITNPKGKVLRYQGKVRYSHPNRLKWIYREPTAKEVCTDGKELIVVDHDLEQVSYYFIAQGLDLTAVLSHAKVHTKDIYLATYQDRRYTIKVDRKGHIESIAYFDDLDNKVQILFLHIRYGKGAIAPAKMRCKAPKGYDVIRG